MKNNKGNLAQVLPLDSKSGPTDKDGYDGNKGLTQIVIDIALNGFSVTFVYNDGFEEKYVFPTFKEVLECIEALK